MATTPSIEEKIKAAAQEKGIPPELALRIANAESANKPNAQNPRSTAGGLFQIIDQSWKDYKGAPGKKYDVDENIRVGTDIIADNQNRMQKLLNRAPSYSEVYAAHFFGPKTAKTVITASPDTPTEKILSSKVLAANPKLQGKTAADVLALMDKKVGPAVAPPMMAKAPPNTAVAVAPAAAAGAAKAPVTAPVTAPVAAPVKKVAQAAPAPAQAAPSTDLKARIADLGPNYHAAMALAYLSDNTDEDDPAIQAYKERTDEEASHRALFEEAPPVAISDVDLKVRSPFPEPVAAARGGLIHRAGGSPPEGESGYFQDPMGVADSGPVTADTRAPSKAPSAKSMLDMVKEVGSGAARNVKNLALGAADVPYDFAGIPVDLTTMAMRPFGYKVEKPIMGSDWLKQQATELGLRVPESKDERDQGFRLAGEIGAGLVNPSSVVRGGVKAGTKAADMLRKATAVAPVEQAPVAAASLSAMATKKGATAMPFYSPLDQYARTLTGPVSGQEFIKQLQNKGFRAYDVERAKEAVQNLGKSSEKMTPSEVMDALDATHPPENFITKIDEPGTVGHTYSASDNVYYTPSKQTPPMGVISLHLPVTEEIKQGREIKDGLTDLLEMRLNVNHPLVESNLIQKITNDAMHMIGEHQGGLTQQIIDAYGAVDFVKAKQKELVPYLDQIPEYLQLKKQFEYPIQYSDPARYSRLLDVKRAEGKTFDEAQNIVKEDLRRETGAKILNFFGEAGIPRYSNSIFKDVARAETPIGQGEMQGKSLNYPTHMEMEFRAAEDAINQNLRQFQGDISPTIRALKESIPRSLAPRVGHEDLFMGSRTTQQEANPIAFSRFIDQSGYINKQKMDGMYVPELQSDLFRDVKSRGTLGKNESHDAPKIKQLKDDQTAIEAQIEELKNERRKVLVDDPKWTETTNKINNLRNMWNQKLEKISALGDRTYDVTPAFAGMETSPQVVQQLAAKNAVIAGIQRGKNFVAFPGAESDQAQLYEKLPRNLDQVIKDLGPGFVRQVVELPLPEGVHYSKLGKMISAGTVKYPTDARGMRLTNEPGRMLSEAIVWSPEAAARILKQGVRFSHGGSVERRADDNRRYL